MRNRIADREGVMIIYPANGALRQSWPSRKRQVQRPAGVLRNFSVIFRTFLGSTDATAAHPS
jgi:hypothetical protein